MRRAARLAVAAVAVIVAAAGTPWTTAQEPSSPPGEDDPGQGTYRGTDPDRDLKAYDPKPLDIVRAPSKLAGYEDRRAIRLVAGAVELVQGAEVLRRITIDTSTTVPFDRIADAVGDPAWVGELRPGRFLLRAAFAQAPGTDVLFGGEGVSELRLAVLPHVFVGGVGATARFEDVTVTSWDEVSASVGTDHGHARPFILYEDGSVLDIVGSEISYLGYDRTTAYGLSWRTDATGSLVDSDVHHNFFGAYTFEVHGILFRDNVFRDNVFYGLDPHDYSTDLVVVGNEAHGNGSHGIIFSRGVVDSVVRRNHAHDNGGNGIVMDFGSDRNVVEANLVEGNDGDGIVILGSSAVLVQRNLVRRNEVGVRLNNQGAASVVRQNQIVSNQIGIQVYGGAHDTELVSNRIDGSTDAGIVLEEAGATSRGDRVTASPVGVEIRAPATLEGTRVRDVETGVRVTERGIATIEAIRVDAGDVGLEIRPGAMARSERSTVTAPVPLSGRLRADLANELRRPLGSLPWFAIAGASFVLLAVVLQLVHRARDRTARARSRSVPEGVGNVP